MKNKIIIMLGMQDAMNSKVNPDWRNANNEWYRAIWTECAEMMDHYGWKWWKHQKPDVEQVKLEMVDIFHFAMSESLLANHTVDEIAQRLTEEFLNADTQPDLLCAVEALAMYSISHKQLDYTLFADIMNLLGMDFDELYRMYVGKNVLNFFRQDHGYKEGSYIKIWDGREDNEVLADLLQSLDSDSETFKDDVYSGLQKAYPE